MSRQWKSSDVINFTFSRFPHFLEKQTKEYVGGSVDRKMSPKLCKVHLPRKRSLRSGQQGDLSWNMSRLTAVYIHCKLRTQSLVFHFQYVHQGVSNGQLGIPERPQFCEFECPSLTPDIPIKYQLFLLVATSITCSRHLNLQNICILQIFVLIFL